MCARIEVLWIYLLNSVYTQRNFVTEYPLRYFVGTKDKRKVDSYGLTKTLFAKN